MVEIQPLQIEVEQEEDGRFLASVPELPGAMAYGATEASATRKAKAIALQVLADMVENGEDAPQPLPVLFAAWVRGAPLKANRPILHRPGGRGARNDANAADGRLRA